MVFKILMKKLRVEDSEAYREIMRMNYETFCKIFTAILHILLFAISVSEPAFSKTADRSFKRENYNQLLSRIRTCPKYMVVKQ